MEDRTKVLQMIHNAEWHTSWLMSGYVFSEYFVRGHLYSSAQLMNEEEIKKFLEFFEEK